jgi:hypothetical protein
MFGRLKLGLGAIASVSLRPWPWELVATVSAGGIDR